MRIAPLSEEFVARWDSFVQSHPEATFFHRSGWKTVLEESFGHRTHFLLAESHGEIEGVLPLAEIDSRLFGHSLVSLPFCVYGGIAAASVEAELALDEAAQALAVRLGVGHLEYRHLRARHGDWPRSDLYATFRKRIGADHEANLQAIPRKQRAMVRKGIKAGLSCRLEGGVERFFALYADNVHRQGTPALPRRYFELLRRVFGDDCEVMVVSRGDEALSGVLAFYFRDEVLPYYAGDVPAAREAAANDFKYWELMRRAAERGCRVFDYGRSKRGTGAFDFKRNWGFEPTPLPYEYKLVRARAIPQNNPTNPRYRLLISAWRRMPLALATRLGPHIVKNIG